MVEVRPSGVYLMRSRLTHEITENGRGDPESGFYWLVCPEGFLTCWRVLKSVLSQITGKDQVLG